MWEANVHWLPPICTWTGDYMCPDWGLNPQPRYVPWLGIKPTTPWLRNDAPTNWVTSLRAVPTLLKKAITSCSRMLATLSYCTVRIHLQPQNMKWRIKCPRVWSITLQWSTEKTPSTMRKSIILSKKCFKQLYEDESKNFCNLFNLFYILCYSHFHSFHVWLWETHLGLGYKKVV